MQIHINSKSDQKLLQQYPDDPYSNLTIITQTRRLNLQLAYLSIDSTFFAEIDPDTRQVNLSHLSQQPLLRVIRSLYGQPLIANSISQLSQLYSVIKELEVEDYRVHLEEDILNKPMILQSIEFLEFSFSNDILVKEVVERHIENRLKLLQSNRNYLQLNKITVNTFHILLQHFINNVIENYTTIQNLLAKPQSQIINHVMQNYFNRNNIKPTNYFKQQFENGHNCHQMEIIWNKYHHVYSFPGQLNNNQVSQKQFGTSMTNLPSMTGTSAQFLSVKHLPEKKKSEEVVAVYGSPSQTDSQENQRKKKLKIIQLQQKVHQRNDVIAQLQRQIQSLKSKEQKQQKQQKKQKKQKQQKQQKQIQTKRRSSCTSGNYNLPPVINQEDFLKYSSNQDSLSFIHNIKKPRKSKDYEEEEDFTVSSVFEPAFNGMRRLPELKEVRTMKKVTGTTGLRTKFLPN